jgi:amidase
MRRMPVRIVADGVLTRSVHDTAAFYREAERVIASST